MEDLKKENLRLKYLVIFLSKCYQENYDTFACSQNYSWKALKELGGKKHEIICKLFHNFSTIQGSQFRDVIEELSTLPLMGKITPIQIEEIFNYSKEEKRKEIFEKKWSKKAQEEKLKKIKEMWA